MDKIRVTAVEYMNTYPFIYGLEHSGIKQALDLLLATPAGCANYLTSGKADIGLMPVAALDDLPTYQIISDYCIGAEKKVRTVILASHVPIGQVERVYLDYQSRTSVELVKILAREHWKINPEYLTTKPGYEKTTAKHDAAVIIGDRVFDYEKKFSYIYDLASEWHSYSGLPFVFACWVAVKDLPGSFLEGFNAALSHGVHSIGKMIQDNYRGIQKIKYVHGYYQENISYGLDGQKKKALGVFLKQIKS
jgi:chorismate dehydratase